jgi:O-antigen/teichoic acid export membrane protein
VLQVLAWTFPFTCLKDLLYAAALARRQHALAIGIFGVAVVVNVALNAALIPRLEIQGAAVATVAAEVFVVAIYLARQWAASRRSTRTAGPSA